MVRISKNLIKVAAFNRINTVTIELGYCLFYFGKRSFQALIYSQSVLEPYIITAQLHIKTHLCSSCCCCRSDDCFASYTERELEQKIAYFKELWRQQ